MPRLRTALLLTSALVIAATPVAADTITLLNVSYDPTRELYKAYNDAFAAHWKAAGGGDTVTVRMSHGGSGKQARAVIDGLEADVVTLALPVDIDEIAAASGRIAPDWQQRLPNASTPYTSTVVFLVREGNPRGIADWGDLAGADVAVITPNPKTSGGARWNYLAAWIWASEAYGGDEAKVRDYITRLFRNVPVLDTGARGATTTFAQRGIGDVLIAWENEAFLALEELGAEKFDIVVPSVSVLAEPPVAVVDANVDANGHRAVAEAYLEYLYSSEGQTLAARNFYRPAEPGLVDPAELARFADVRRVRVEDAFGSWAAVQERHFANGGIFDQIYRPGT